MSSSKRFIIIGLFLLLILSFIDDLNKEKNIPENESFVVEANNIAHIKIQPGDTLLSITEEINDLEYLDINQIISDFQKLNPDTDPNVLIPNKFYYFPIYSQ